MSMHKRPLKPNLELDMGSRRMENDQRAALFSIGRQSDNGSGRQNTQQQHAASVLETLEAQNDSQLIDLEAMVGELKKVSVKMKEHVDESNTLLGSMVPQFDRVVGGVKHSLRRLNMITQSGGTRYVWYLMLFAVAVIFGLYLLAFRII